MEQQNGRLPHVLTNELGKKMEPLVQVHAGAGEQAFGSSFVVAKAQHVPPAPMASAEAHRLASSGSASVTAHSSLREGTESVPMNVGGGQPGLVERLIEDLERQKPQRSMIDKIIFGKGI